MEPSNDYIVVKKEAKEEQRSKGGIIINISDMFDFKDEFSKKNVIKAEVVYGNESVPFLKSGDRILYNPQKGSRLKMDWEEFTFITKDQYIAKIDKDGKYIVPPECVMVKIRKEDHDSLYSKTIVRDDGTKVQLFIQPEPDKDSTQRSKIFVNIAEVIQVGVDVKGIEVGDETILDYTIDNDIDNVLYFDENGNKYIVITGTTLMHQYDEWAYGTRQNPRDAKVASAGDIKTFSPILGLIRNNKLIARFPNVFLEHKSTLVEKKSQLGITYTDYEFILERKVLSVSDESKKIFGIKDSQVVVIQDIDMFDVKLKDGSIQCIMDRDIMIGYDT